MSVDDECSRRLGLCYPTRRAAIKARVKARVDEKPFCAVARLDLFAFTMIAAVIMFTTNEETKDSKGRRAYSWLPRTLTIEVGDD